MVDANQGWRMPGDRSPRWDVATATQCARALEPLGVYWLEEPLPTRRRRGLRARCAPARRCGSRPARWCAACSRRATSILRGGVDVVQPDVVLAGGIGGCRRIAALADLCGRTFSPHTWSNGFGLLANLHLALARVDVPATSRCRSTRRAGAPERRDWLLGGPADRDRRRRHDRAAARPRPGRDARPRRARGAPGRLMRIRAPPCCTRTARRSRCVETSSLEPAARGRGAGARRRGGRLPLRPPPRRRPPRRRAPADRARARGRRRRRGGRRGRRRRRARATGRVLLRARRAARAAPARRAGATSARRPPQHAWAGTMLDGTRACAWPTARAVQHFNFVSCFAEHCVVPAACAVADPAGAAAVAGGAARLRRGDGVRRRAQRGAVSQRGRDRLRHRLRRRRAADGRGGPARRRRADHRGRPRRGEARARARARRDRRSVQAGGPRDAGRASRRSSPGGVDHAFEAVGRPATIRLAWDVLRPGATAVVVGIAPRGVEVALPALDLLSEKGCAAATTGRATRPRCSPRGRAGRGRASPSPTSSPT